MPEAVRHKSGKNRLAGPALHLAACAFVFGVVVWWGKRWLGPGVPPGDFPGSVAYLHRLISDPNSMHGWQLWMPHWFFGGSFVLMRANLLGLLMMMPFTHGATALEAAKTASLFYMAASAVTMYLFAYWLLRSRGGAVAAALVYALHPISVALVAKTGHANFPPFFAVLPLAFLSAGVLAKKPGVHRVFVLAVSIFCLFWIDNERCLITAPFVVLFYLVEVACAAGPNGANWRAVCRALPRLAGAVILSILIGAFVILPGLIEAGHHYLFSESSKAESVETFSLHNPLYLADRDGVFLESVAGRVASEYTFNRGMFYLTTVSVIAAIASLAMARALQDRARVTLFVGSVALVVFLSGGVVPFGQATDGALSDLFKHVPGHVLVSFESLMAFGLTAVGAIGIPLAWVLAGDVAAPPTRTTRLLIVSFLGVVFFCTTPFPVLQKLLPIYSHMRSPTWFLTTMPAFSSGVVVGFAAARLASSRICRSFAARALAVVLILAAVGLDYRAYRRHFSLFYTREIEQSAATLAASISSTREGRILAFETYEPMADLCLAWSGRASAWSWLNWDSPRGAGRYVLDRLYPALHDSSRLAEALSLCRKANISHILAPTGLENALTGSGLLTKVVSTPWQVLYAVPESGPYAVIEDSGHGVDRQVVSMARSPGYVRVEVTQGQPATLRICESFYPGWTATIDGIPCQVAPRDDAFLSVSLASSAKAVTFRYQKPWYFAAGMAISVAALVSWVAFVFRGFLSWRRRPRAPGGGVRPGRR